MDKIEELIKQLPSFIAYDSLEWRNYTCDSFDPETQNTRGYLHINKTEGNIWFASYGSIYSDDFIYPISSEGFTIIEVLENMVKELKEWRILK